MKASQRLCTAFIQQYTGASSSIERPLAYYRLEICFRMISENTRKISE